MSLTKHSATSSHTHTAHSITHNRPIPYDESMSATEADAVAEAEDEDESAYPPPPVSDPFNQLPSHSQRQSQRSSRKPNNTERATVHNNRQSSPIVTESEPSRSLPLPLPLPLSSPSPSSSSYALWQSRRVPPPSSAASAYEGVTVSSSASSSRVPIKLERQRASKAADISSGVAGALHSLAIKKKEKERRKKMKKLKNKGHPDTDEEVNEHSEEVQEQEQEQESGTQDEEEHRDPDPAFTPLDTEDLDALPHTPPLSGADSSLSSSVSSSMPVQEQIDVYRRDNGIGVVSVASPSTSVTADVRYYPVRSFHELASQFGLPLGMLGVFFSRFSVPTPIQAQCWPVLLAGRDCIGIAQTGSGKTLAFMFAATIHILSKTNRLASIDTQIHQQNSVQGSESTVAALPTSVEHSGARPLALVLCPTRELAAQISRVASEILSVLHIASLCLTGGPSLESHVALLRSADAQNIAIVIGTPGRILQVAVAPSPTPSTALSVSSFPSIASPAAPPSPSLVLSGCNYVVLDEADRMLDLGFADDISVLLSLCAVKRQTALFSATWNDKAQRLADTHLRVPKCLKVTVGRVDGHDAGIMVAPSVRQIAEWVDRKGGRRDRRLLELIEEYHSSRRNKVLIFVLYKREAEQVCAMLNRKGWSAAFISSDKSPAQRLAAIQQFASGQIPVLVATDVAARGLDISDISHVINYSMGLSLQSYIHRAGRTGRAGHTGTAHTLVVDYDFPHIPQLIALIDASSSTRAAHSSSSSSSHSPSHNVVDPALREIGDRALRKAAKHLHEPTLEGDELFAAKKMGKINKSTNSVLTGKAHTQSDSDSVDSDDVLGDDCRVIQLKTKKIHPGQAANRNQAQHRKGKGKGKH